MIRKPPVETCASHEEKQTQPYLRSEYDITAILTRSCDRFFKDFSRFKSILNALRHITVIAVFGTVIMTSYFQLLLQSLVYDKTRSALSPGIPLEPPL